MSSPFSPIFYVETSALNYFRKILSNEDAIATHALQNELGRRWALSPITVWELLLTKDLVRKESLIRLAQHLLDPEILPSPEELLIRYIEQGCPLEENGRPLTSSLPIAQTWRELCAMPERTFVYDELYLRAKVKELAHIVRDLYKITKRRSIYLSPYSHELSQDLTLENLVNDLTFVRAGDHLTDHNKRLYKITIFYILVLLCAGIGPHPEGTFDFWRKRKLKSTISRLRYLLSEHETLVWRGPVAQMAMMTLVQADGPYSRGLFWDCLHAFYLTYTSIFFSEDRHFSELRSALKDHPNGEKIIKPSEQAWTSKQRPIKTGRIIVP